MSSIEGYDAILVRGTPRYRKDRKMVPAADVPQGIRAQLEFELKQPKPIAVLESPAEQQERDIPQEAGVVPIEEHPLEGEDFADKGESSKPTTPAEGMPSEYEMELIAENEKLKATLAEQAEQKATPLTYNATWLAKELYENYGVYTALTGMEPKMGDVHPFTMKPMNRYELGLAYQAFKFADNNPEKHDLAAEQKQREHDRNAEQTHANEMARRQTEPNFDQPKWESFADRTSVAGQNRQSSTRQISRPNDPISEDVTAEPENGVRGQTIRPQW